jgi:hypothetical protein
MSRAERPTLPAFQAYTFVRPAETPTSADSATTSDDEPPSGVIVRREVLASVPRLAVTMSELTAMQLDHQAGFILSFVDGIYSIEMILDACALRQEEALAILGELALRGVIAVD